MAKEQSSRSGGVDLDADRIDIGGDVVGRDKIVVRIQQIDRRARTAAEEAEQAKAFEAQRLAQGVSAFAQRLQARASDTTDADKGGPYKGLLEYRLSDAELFFGRARAIGELIERLGRGPLTVLHAESGAGKTSLLQAGIAPRLIASGHLPIYLRPYNLAPSLALKRALLPNLSDAPNLAQVSLRDFLARVVEVLGAQTTLYVFLDQFEEFFTQYVGTARFAELPSQPAQADFVRELAECLDDESLNVRWLLSLRSEFFGELANFRPRIRNPFENDYRLSRLSHAEAREAMAEPAARRGITFEGELIDALLNDLGKDEVAPPQAQLVCSTLYEALSPGETVITHELYRAQGGAAGILRGHLGRVLNRDLPAVQRPIAQRLLETLTTSDVRRVIRTQDELAAELAPQGIQPETLDAILNQLVDGRLLRVEEVDGRLAYELAHDYLLDEIKLDPAVQARKAAQELLEQEMRAYRQHRTLLSADKLAIIKPRQADLVLSETAKQLIVLSERKVRRQQGMFLSGLGLVALLIVVGAISVVTAIGAQRAEQSARDAEQASNIRRATIEAAADEALDQERAANLALRAAFERTGVVTVGGQPTAFVFDGQKLWIANRFDSSVQAIDPLTGQASRPIYVAESPIALAFDGARVWVASNTISVVQSIDPVAGEVGEAIRVGAGPRALIFDGTRLWVANSSDNSVQSIDPATGEVGKPILVGAEPVALAFDGARLWVANTLDDTIQSVDPVTGQTGRSIQVGDNPYALFFDGTRVWVANRTDNTVQAIDPASGAVAEPIQVGDLPVALTFDGVRLWVANDFNHTVQAIDVATGAVGDAIPVGADPRALAFDGTRIWVAEGGDDTLRAFRPTLGDVSQPIPVDGAIAALAFDGRLLWIANTDEGVVQPLDPDTRQFGEPIPVGAATRALAVDPARAQLWVADGAGNSVQPIDLDTRQPGEPIAVGRVPGALALDGQRLWVANYQDETIQAVDLTTHVAGAPIPTGGFPSAFAFDGRRLWVLNFGEDVVLAIDPATGQTLTRISSIEYASGLVFDGRKLWVVAGVGREAVWPVDVTTGAIGEPAPVGAGARSPVIGGGRLWVAISVDDSVQAIDLTTGQASPPISVGVYPSELAFDGSRLWVANQGNDTLQFVIVHQRVNE